MSYINRYGVQYRMFATMSDVFLEVLTAAAHQHLPAGTAITTWDRDLVPLWAAFLNIVFTTAAEKCTHHVCHILSIHSPL